MVIAGVLFTGSERLNVLYTVRKGTISVVGLNPRVHEVGTCFDTCYGRQRYFDLDRVQ